MTPDLYRRNWFSTTMRDVVVIGGCVLGEFSSLRAFPMVFRNFRRFIEKRQQIMRWRRASDEYMAAWFSPKPVSYRASEIEAKIVEHEKIASR
jgi:hypothetical protein